MPLSLNLMRVASNITRRLHNAGISQRVPMPQFQNGILSNILVTGHQRPSSQIYHHRMHNTESKGKGDVLVSKVQTKKDLNIPIENVSGIEHDHHQDKDGVEDEEDEMEQEEMFVKPHDSFGHDFVEWGGPTRGGRLSEPTRFGDWERKGRCTDF